MPWDERRLGVFVTQHNHTKAIYGHVGVGDSISGVIRLRFKLRQRFFNGFSTAAQTLEDAIHAAGGDCQWDERRLGVFVMQHNHTKAIHGHIDVGDSDSGVVRLKSKRHQLFL